MSKRRRRRRRHPFLSFFALALIALAVWSLWGNTALEGNELTFSSGNVPPALDGFVIAHVSDLHDAVLGKDNSDIVSMLEKRRPDIIVLTGDMVDSNRGNTERSVALMEKLTRIAPVYYVNGNHEAALSYSEYQRLVQGFTAAGVNVLEDRSELISFRGETFQLIGLRDVGFIPGSIGEKRQQMQNALYFLERDDLFSLVLAHRPEFFDNYAACGVDLVLCGHAHGGQFRLPLIGGVYSPGQGLWPKYDSGLYNMGDTSMIVSRGLGNSNFPLRVNNRPEILFITLRSAGRSAI